MPDMKQWLAGFLVVSSLLAAMACSSDAATSPPNYTVVEKRVDTSGSIPIYHVGFMLFNELRAIEYTERNCFDLARIGEAPPEGDLLSPSVICR